METKAQIYHTNIIGIPGYNDIRHYGSTDRKPPDLYIVKGFAPTYTNLEIGGTFKDVKMNWWIYRRNLFAINYKEVFDHEDFDITEVLAVNQFFLLEEAEIFKSWIDELFPEENTTIYQVQLPLKGKIYPYPIYWDSFKICGSFWCNREDWDYTFPICFFIDVSKCEIINKENNV